jgi:hypothetical protein
MVLGTDKIGQVNQWTAFEARPVVLVRQSKEALRNRRFAIFVAN